MGVLPTPSPPPPVLLQPGPQCGQALLFRQILLFRQVCLLAALAGLLAWQHPGPGLLACFLLAFLLLSPQQGRQCLLFALSFALGLVFAAATQPLSPEPASFPAWVREAATPPGADHAAPAPGDASPYTAGLALRGTIRENTALAGNRSRLILENVRAAGEASALPGGLSLTWQDPPPELAAAGPGQVLAATLRIREVRGFANPGTWNSETYWHEQGVFFRAWSKGDGSRNGKNPPYALGGEASCGWRLRQGLRADTLAALSGGDPAPKDLPQAAAVMPALLFGDRSYFAPETLTRVAASTLAHSLALSGMHLGFAAALAYAAVNLAGFFCPTLFLRIPRQKAGLLLALPLCLCYLWLGNSPPSLVRAALMFLFWTCLLWLNRPKVLLDGLLLAVGCIVLVTPAALYDIRLQLSAVSVAGIALALPLLRRVEARGAPPEGNRARAFFLRIGRVLAGMAVVSLAAQAAVLPLTLGAFAGTGLWFPLNFIWLPLLGFWVMPLAFAGLLTAGLGCGSAAAWLFDLAQLPCTGLFSLLQAMDAAGMLAAPVGLRPAFPTSAGYWLLLLLIPAVAVKGFSRRTLAAFCLGLILAVGPSLPPLFSARSAVAVHLLDTGQSQAVLITWRSGAERGRMLVDGGGFASPYFDAGRELIAPLLTDNTAPRLHLAVNTHPDTDHLQGMLFLLEAFRIERFATGPGAFARTSAATSRRDAALSRRGLAPEIWRAGDRIPLAADLHLEVLHPAGEAPGVSANDAALVLRLVWRGKALALLCGDLEREGLQALRTRGPSLGVEVLLLPHHGSAGSLSPALYDAVRPALALAACGKGNFWNFPAASVRAALAGRGIPLATTADKGQIRVIWDDTLRMRVEYTRK